MVSGKLKRPLSYKGSPLFEGSNEATRLKTDPIKFCGNGMH